jgi:hypothetical protein
MDDHTSRGGLIRPRASFFLWVVSKRLKVVPFLGSVSQIYYLFARSC